MLLVNIRKCFRAFQCKTFRQINYIPIKIVVGLAIVFLWVYANGANGVNGVNGYNKYEDIISCYNNELEDDLPQMENHRFNSTKKHIYFHETTCNGSLGPRQACVVESAARFHPDWQINIAFSAPMNMSSRANLNPFQGFSNVKFWRVNILKYVKNTPVEYLITRHYLNKSYDAVRHAADILRLVTLYKWDGVYLDLDALLVKPLYDLERNFVTRENDYSVSTGLLSFSNDSAGRSIAKEVLWELATTFNPKLFVYNGPGLMTRKFEMYCNTNNFSQMTMPTCKGIRIYGPSYFYTIPWTEGRKYFEPGNWVNNFSYGYHFWNSRTETFNISNSSTITQLAKKYCPFIYQLNKEHFGFSELP